MWVCLLGLRVCVCWKESGKCNVSPKIPYNFIKPKTKIIYQSRPHTFNPPAPHHLSIPSRVQRCSVLQSENIRTDEVNSIMTRLADPIAVLALTQGKGDKGVQALFAAAKRGRRASMIGAMPVRASSLTPAQAEVARVKKASVEEMRRENMNTNNMNNS